MERDFDIVEFELVEAPSAAYDFFTGVAAGATVYGVLVLMGC